MRFDAKTLSQLDYYRIRETIAGYSLTQDGRDELLLREPSTDTQHIQLLKERAAEWTVFISSQRKNALAAWEPILPLVEMLAVDGASLEANELFALGQFCGIAANAAQTLLSASQSLPIPKLTELASGIPDVSQAAAIIFHVLDKNGQLRDLPELREIRAEISRLRREIDGIMRSYTSDPALRDTLQSDVPALRSDRQVLAIKAGSKGRIRGIIHEVSQTGQTVYIEPEEIVKKNNELVQEEYRLAAAIRRILKDTTTKLAPFRYEMEAARNILLQLDTSYAAARWGIETNGIYAANCEDGQPPALIQGRHPLLEEKAVPIDVVFPDGCRVIIVTGPNTGGKTVTLKTLALFILLNQSGFPVPAAEGTRLPICSGVFVDIGDEQSLDQSLSTFSGHMKNIAETLALADCDSLVLLDELGSGTDPQEGGAIAMAVLDTLIDKGCRVLVTTHHGVLKNYGYTHPACINASVEFDEETLAPTYRLRAGIPGESHALDIARRNGLPVQVVDKAASYLTSEQADVSAMIRALAAKHEEAERLQDELRCEQQRIREKRRDVDLRELRVRQQKLELEREDNRESRRFLNESRKKLENLVRELREGEITQQKTRAVKQYIAQLAETVQDSESQTEQQELLLQQDRIATDERHAKEASTESHKRATHKKRLKNKDALALASSALTTESKYGTRQTEPPEFISGMEIVTNSTHRHGTLIRQSGNHSWLVQFGSMRLTLNERDMAPVAGASRPAPSFTVEFASEENSSEAYGGASTNTSTPQDATPVMELRLLGMRHDEAIKALERQLDLASIKGLRTFAVIHGKGNGVLQQAVRDYLSHYPGVKEFHFARPEDGGSGKTYVLLG